MPTFTPEQRDAIRAIIEKIIEPPAPVEVKKAPVVLEPAKAVVVEPTGVAKMMGRFRGFRTIFSTAKAPEVSQDLDENLIVLQTQDGDLKVDADTDVVKKVDARASLERITSVRFNPDTNPYFYLSQFLKMVYEEGKFSDNDMLAISTLSDQALSFFPGTDFINAAATGLTPDQLKRVYAHESGLKFELISKDIIIFNDIARIQRDDHPLLNVDALTRLHDLKSTFRQEFSLVEIQGQIEKLLVVKIRKYLNEVQYVRLMVLLDEKGPEKADMLKAWLETRLTEFQAQSKLGHYEFFKAQQMVPLFEILNEHRFKAKKLLGSKTTSYSETEEFLANMDKIDFSIKAKDMKVFLQELKFAYLLLLTHNNGDSVSGICSFFEANPDFNLGYVEIQSDKNVEQVFQSAFLRAVMNTLFFIKKDPKHLVGENLAIIDENKAVKDVRREFMTAVIAASGQKPAAIPAVKWSDISLCVAEYYVAKSQSMTGKMKISRVIEPIARLIREYGANPEDFVDATAKQQLIRIIHERYAGSDVDESKKSQKTCSDIMNLLYGVESGLDQQVLHFAMKQGGKALKRTSGLTFTLEAEANARLSMIDTTMNHITGKRSSSDDLLPPGRGLDTGAATLNTEVNDGILLDVQKVSVANSKA